MSSLQEICISAGRMPKPQWALSHGSLKLTTTNTKLEELTVRTINSVGLRGKQLDTSSVIARLFSYNKRRLILGYPFIGKPCLKASNILDLLQFCRRVFGLNLELSRIQTKTTRQPDRKVP